MRAPLHRSTTMRPAAARGYRTPPSRTPHAASAIVLARRMQAEKEGARRIALNLEGRGAVA